MTMPSPHPNWVINKVAQPLPQIHPWAKAKKGRRKEERTCMFLHLRLRACAPPVALARRGGSQTTLPGTSLQSTVMASWRAQLLHKCHVLTVTFPTSSSKPGTPHDSPSKPLHLQSWHPTCLRVQCIPHETLCPVRAGAMAVLFIIQLAGPRTLPSTYWALGNHLLSNFIEILNKP